MLRPNATAPVALVLFALMLAALAAASASAHTAHRLLPRARDSATVRVHDSGHLRFRSDAATAIVDEGTLSGTMPGKAEVTFHYDGSPKVFATFVIHAASGAIYGRAHCVLHNPTSRAPSFHGALAIVGGTGRYAHARGKGGLYGVFYRHGYSLSVQAVGKLSY